MLEETKKVTDDAIFAYIENLVAKSRAAQKKFEAAYVTNRSVDEVVRAIGVATCDHADEMAGAALSETKMGNLEGKKSKLVGTCHMQWCMCKGQNTIDYEECPGEPGVRYLPKPMGVIGAVMPSTNPVATLIVNAMMALKCRNSIIIAAHPASVHVSEKLINILRTALKEVGAPEDLILGIGAEMASKEATQMLMSMTDCNLATGGAAMVKAAYSAGKPAIGVGQGNTQEVLDRDITMDELEQAVTECVHARTYDNGVPCGGTQTDHVPAEFEEKYLELMRKHGAYVITDDEQKNTLRELLFPDGKNYLNRAVVGQVPYELGKMCGLPIPENTSLILVKNEVWGDKDVLCGEILCPVLRYTTYEKFEDAVDRVICNLEYEGAGHNTAIRSNNPEHIDYMARRVPSSRFHVNQSTMGNNNGLNYTITIGCGTWGGGSVSENVTFRHLLNKTKVTTRVPNLRSPLTDELASWDNFEPFKRLLD